MIGGGWWEREVEGLIFWGIDGDGVLLLAITLLSITISITLLTPLPYLYSNLFLVWKIRMCE